MNVTALVQTLLSCYTLFPDGRHPTSVKMTSFQFSPTEGITVHTWTNGTGEEVKKIMFDGTGFDRIRIQMMEKDGKVVLGGQVGQKAAHTFLNCPLAGDMEQLSFVLKREECNNPNCFYRMKDLIYMVHATAGRPCLVSDLKGNPVWDTTVLRQPDISCSSPLGQSPNEDVSVFTVNGECKQIDHSVLNISWTPTPCLKPKIELEPNVYSKFYHLRYLLAISGCGGNMTDSDVIDNTYVKFLYNPSEAEELNAGGVDNWLGYLPYGVGAIVLVILILSIVFWMKLKGFGEKKQRPCTYKEAAVIAEPAICDEFEKERIKECFSKPPVREEVLKQWEEKKEKRHHLRKETDNKLRKENQEKVKIGEKLKAFKLAKHKLVPAEMVVDEQTKMTVPNILHCTESYKYSRYLGAGTLGKVFMYTSKSESERSVAVKIVEKGGRKEAEGEIKLMGEIQSKYGQFAFVYLLEVLEAGQFPDFLFIMMPMYHRTMEFFMPGNPAFDKSSNISHRLCVAWEYLKGIQQLHSLGYGHNDICPRNFMQVHQGRREIVLINFGLVKRFGSKRKTQEGTYLYMPLNAYQLKDTSNVDDYQSWLFIVTFMLRKKIEWTEIEGPNEAILEDLDKKKREFFEKLPPFEKCSYVDGLLYKLRRLIMRGHGPEFPVEVDKVVDLMSKYAECLGVGLGAYEWHNIDFEP